MATGLLETTGIYKSLVASIFHLRTARRQHLASTLEQGTGHQESHRPVHTAQQALLCLVERLPQRSHLRLTARTDQVTLTHFGRRQTGCPFQLSTVLVTLGWSGPSAATLHPSFRSPACRKEVKALAARAKLLQRQALHVTLAACMVLDAKRHATPCLAPFLFSQPWSFTSAASSL